MEREGGGLERRGGKNPALKIHAKKREVGRVFFNAINGSFL